MGFFANLARRRLKPGVFRSVCDLKAAINRVVAKHNEGDAKRFVWRADPAAITAARGRGFSPHRSSPRRWDVVFQGQTQTERSCANLSGRLATRVDALVPTRGKR